MDKMFKVIHVQEDKREAREKTNTVVKKFRFMKWKKDAEKAADGIEKILARCDFSSKY